MTNITYHQVETMDTNMRIVFEFPSASANENQIKQEVNAILIAALHEQLQKMSVAL